MNIFYFTFQCRDLIFILTEFSQENLAFLSQLVPLLLFDRLAGLKTIGLGLEGFSPVIELVSLGLQTNRLPVHFGLDDVHRSVGPGQPSFFSHHPFGIARSSGSADEPANYGPSFGPTFAVYGRADSRS